MVTDKLMRIVKSLKPEREEDVDAKKLTQPLLRQLTRVYS